MAYYTISVTLRKPLCQQTRLGWAMDRLPARSLAMLILFAGLGGGRILLLPHVTISSRRTVLARAVAAATLGWLMGSRHEALPTSAAPGEPVVAGRVTRAGSTATELRASAAGKDTLRIINAAAGHAVRASGIRGGVVGTSPRGAGVSGVGRVGVKAVGVDDGDVPGKALEVRGTAVFSSAGTTVVGAGKRSALVGGQKVNGRSLVVATVQGTGAHISVAAEVLPSNEVQIHLSEDAPVGGLTVAFFIIEQASSR